MTKAADLSTSNNDFSLPSTLISNHPQPLLEGKQNVTYVFCPKQSRASNTCHHPEPVTKPPFLKTQARQHHDFNTTTTMFDRSLDWLLNTTKEMDRRHRHSTSLHRTPLAEESLHAVNFSKQGAIENGCEHSKSAQTPQHENLRRGQFDLP